MKHAAPWAIDRRRLLAAAMLAPVLDPASVWARVASGGNDGVDASQRRALTIICDLVIPATDTPGAVAAGVPAFVIVALKHGLDGTRDAAATPAIAGAAVVAGPGRGGLVLLDRVGSALATAAGGDFGAAPPLRQRAALTAIDTAAFAPGGAKHPWHKIKNLILTGYYTSEIGASRELRYELVPGRWDADIALRPGDRAWSSDWTAVDFG